MSSIKYRLFSATGLLVCLISTQLFAQDSIPTASNGLIKIKSAHSVENTINQLEIVLLAKGMAIFKRINHTAGAEKVDLLLRPTELLIFGNPKVGTPLMLCSQTAALDLPQKALAYKDESGQVWLVYNDPAYMAKRHNIQGCEKPVQKVTNALAEFARIATE